MQENIRRNRGVKMMVGKERWSEKKGGRKRKVVGKERWSENKGGMKVKVVGK